MMTFDNTFENLTCIYSITFPEMNMEGDSGSIQLPK